MDENIGRPKARENGVESWRVSEREREGKRVCVCVCLRVNGKESVYSREHENKCTRSVCLRKRDQKNSCVQARENGCVCVRVSE